MHKCTNCQKPKGEDDVFHRYPLKRPDVCHKWEIATKLLHFKATENSRLCSDHFIPNDYIYPGSKKLKPDVVPTLLTFPESSSHYKDAQYSRKPPTKRPFHPVCEETPAKYKKTEQLEGPVSPTKEELRELLQKKEDVITQQKKKIKLLHQQVRRKNTTITDLRSAIKVLKEK